MSTPLQIGALASGRGSNVAAIVAAIDRGDLDARLALVISNRAEAPVLELARARGIPALHISARTHEDPGVAILEALVARDVDVVVLAGYLKKLDSRVVDAFRGRALNIHPAPLPRFGGPGMYGDHVHEQVLLAGVMESGPTIHRVTDVYDEGEILAHEPVPVLPGDSPHSLAARVLVAEHQLYWRVIRDAFIGAASGPRSPSTEGGPVGSNHRA